jgi:hypothetical protein
MRPTVFPHHAAAFRLLGRYRAEIDRVRTEFLFLRDRLDSYDLPS